MYTRSPRTRGPACHGRIATTDAKLGLPVVTLCIIPDAGGIVHLPRLVPMAAVEAERMGIVDPIAGTDLPADAAAFATELAKA